LEAFVARIHRANGDAEGRRASVRTRPDGLGDIRLSDAIEMAPLDRLRPAVVNDAIYKRVSRTDPSIIELARDITTKGQVLEPLVVTVDDVIVSGHRWRAGAMLAGLAMVPVRRIRILSTDPRFETYLVSFNRQRVKTAVEQVREEVIRTSPEDARNALLMHREVEAAKAYRRADEAGLRILDPSSAPSGRASPPPSARCSTPPSPSSSSTGVTGRSRCGRSTTACSAAPSSGTPTNPEASTSTPSRATRTCRTC
jgi:hypothetical protein